MTSAFVKWRGRGKALQRLQSKLTAAHGRFAGALLAQVRRGAECEGQMTGPRPAGPLRDAKLFQHRPEYPIPKRRADAEVLSGDFVVADVVPQ